MDKNQKNIKVHKQTSNINENNSNKLNTIFENNNRKFDGIPARIEFIKLLLEGNKLNPMVDFDSCDTEHVENRTNGFDIRTIMTKKNMDFNKLICEIGGKLLYIKSGTTGHTFKGIIYDDDGENELINYAVKVVAYPIRENYGDIYDVKRPENAELMMIRVLSYFVVNNQTPHIVLPIGTFNTSIKPFIALAKNKIVENKKYDQFVKRYRQSEYHDEVSILISEWANGGDLLDYIRNNYKTMKLRDWRTIFFQILSVLSIIHNKYPGFRHNDLKANNILVQKIDLRKKNNYFLYKLNMGDKQFEYLVPNIGYQIKLWDFDFACIPGIVDNSKVNSDWTDKINVKPVQNRYYDVHYFFNTLTKKGFFPEFWDTREIHHTVKQFIKDIIPEKYAVHNIESKKNVVTERGRILIDDEYTTPDIILQTHEFFNKMRPEINKVKTKSDDE
jgi:serine/threonine protein kinase